MQTTKRDTAPVPPEPRTIKPKPLDTYRFKTITWSHGDKTELDPDKSVATVHDVAVLDKIFSTDPDLKMCADFEAATLPDPSEEPLRGSPWGDATTLLEAALATDELLLLAEQSHDARLAAKPPSIQITGKTVALILSLCETTKAIPKDEREAISKLAIHTHGVDASYTVSHFVDGYTPKEVLLLMLIYAMLSVLAHSGTKQFQTLTATTDKGKRVSWSVCRLRIQAALQTLRKGLDHTKQQNREGH